MKQLLALLIPILAIGGALTQQATHAAGDPATLSALWQESIQAEEQSKYDDALRKTAEYWAKGGDPFLANLRQGWLNYLGKKYDKAAQYYGAASQLQPGALTPLLGLLYTAQAAGDLAGARRSAETLLREDPLNYTGQMALANMAFKAAEYQHSLPIYRRVLSLYPEDMGALSGAAWSAFYLNDRRDAEEGFRKLLGINANYPWAARGLEMATSRPGMNRP